MAILAVAANAACAPMNPAYGAEELDRYFADLRPRALITQAGVDSPARRVALSCGVRVIELSSRTRRGGRSLHAHGRRRTCSRLATPVSPGDVALLLLTSGTTSRPKIVPLTHANICASAYSSGAALALRETDRCLNVLPLFHGHGLIATVMASLAAGASIVMHARLRHRAFLRMDHDLSADLVLRRADHASSHSRPGSTASRASGRQPVALDPLRFGSAAATRFRGTGADLRDHR